MRKNAMTDASDAQWAATVARERIVRFLAAQSPIRSRFWYFEGDQSQLLLESHNDDCDFQK
jgi:hypothetical protein